MRRKVNKWPEGSLITFKCEDSRICFDQTPFSLILREETGEAWIGWPTSWRDRGLEAGRPLVFPKFAWILCQ